MNARDVLRNLVKKRSFRWYALAGVSFIVSLAFAVYNFIVGLLFRLPWNFSIAFYYLVLVIIKAIILYGERRLRKNPPEQLLQKRRTLFTITHTFLLLIDFTLVAPIVFACLQPHKAVDIGMIPTIACAAFTTYKITMACINYTRAKKVENLALYSLKIISLKEAIVSVITLQNTMVAVFGDPQSMLSLTTWTNVGMLSVAFILTLYQFIHLRKRLLRA